MPKIATRLRCLGAALLILGGCQSTDSQVKPKYQPEEMVQPPNDPRYSSEINYPKEYLFTDVIKKNNGKPGNPFQGPGGGGMGGPMQMSASGGGGY